MSLPSQSVALLQAARDLVKSLPADAVLLLTETSLDWGEVRRMLAGCRLFVAAENPALTRSLRDDPDWTVIDLDPEPLPTQERMNTALLKAVSDELLPPGSHVVAIYNGIATLDDAPEPVDSLSVIHLGEHLERMTSQDLRILGDAAPLDVLRAVVDLATEIGREGREGLPIGTILVVGDTRKVLSLSHFQNFNPFRGYSRAERDVRKKDVREQIKEIAKLDGALLIGRDGIAEAACLHLGAHGANMRKGFGSRHTAAAGISKQTSAVAFAVSQSSGSVRVFKGGEEVLHIEPLARPHVWQPFRLETQEIEDKDKDEDEIIDENSDEVS
ncbi:DNA integrity scanning protein DisA nucleotide-binding domain protein [Gemmata sp. JC717]|uniref:DNA integrity scanning protein DisA nucleotide-binding domain protein n=1 Tax=Gemmata algarum TaxID=2975278 RepID=UPI0021BB702C|nr:DNA integrity scanning protein DisA nucleotide-binding domain protein [Gemmata algarum]MDY3552568.1 DNA integrity scanning protein DisA nucleotide-binding domain protein [Gemmata algarum]